MVRGRGRGAGRGRARGGGGSNAFQRNAPSTSPTPSRPAHRGSPNHNRSFASQSPPSFGIGSPEGGINSRSRGRSADRGTRGSRSRPQRARGNSQRIAHSYNTRNNPNAKLDQYTGIHENARKLRSGQSYHTRGHSTASNFAKEQVQPVQVTEQPELAQKEFQSQQEAHSGPNSAFAWAGTPSEFLLEAASRLADLFQANLPQDILKEIVLRAQSWILERSHNKDLDYTLLASRLISEGVLSVLVYVTTVQGQVPKPSRVLNPFGSSVEQHFKASGLASPFAQVAAHERNNSFSPQPQDIKLPDLPRASIFTLDPSGAVIMATPTIDKFLTGLAQIASSGNADELANWMPIEPVFGPIYQEVIQQMRTRFARDEKLRNAPSQDLIKKTDTLLASVKTSTGDEWGGFSAFVAQYLCYIRDVDATNLLDTYDKITDLMTKTNSALNTPDVGVIMLPVTIKFAQVFARLAIGLEKQPELISHLVEDPTDEGGESMSLPERAGNTIRNGFIACLNEHASYPPNQKNIRPIGRHVGVYKLANLCLKIFFQCKKTKSAEQIFMNIGAKSPTIDIYPRGQRVTYLYYLGRYYFSVNHFYRAQAVLQAAYDECHLQKLSQRRLILIYLLTSNLILGRFPSEAAYSKPEAHGFRERFQPICTAIRKGDLPTFRRLTDMHAEHASWFLFHRVFLQIKSRCEVLVWRSLSRRVWLLVGDRGDKPGQSNKMPFLDLNDLVTAARLLESRAMNPLSAHDGGPGNRHTNWVFMSQEPPKEAKYIDPDFEGLEEDEEFFDEEGVDEWNPFLLPNLLEVESIVSSLVSQGLVNGYISPMKKLAIQGAKNKEGQKAGWPEVWGVIKKRCESYEQGSIPGWKKGGSGFQGGVVHLSGVRGIGS